MTTITVLGIILITITFVMSLAKMSKLSDDQMEKMYEDYNNKAAAKEQKVKSYNSCKNTDAKMKELNMTDGDSASSSVRH